MARSLCIASVALAIVSFCNAGHGQTSKAPIASFDEVAGKWRGHANNHHVTLEIDTTGRFTAKSALGGESGAAKLENGDLVIPLTEHKGMLQLTWDGETLKGPGQIAGKTAMVSLARD